MLRDEQKEYTDSRSYQFVLLSTELFERCKKFSQRWLSYKENECDWLSLI